MLRAFKIPLTWGDMLKRTAVEVMADNCMGLAVFIVASLTLVLVGPTLAEKVAVWAHMGQAFTWAWTIVQWPLVFALVTLGIALIYRSAPWPNGPGAKRKPRAPSSRRSPARTATSTPTCSRRRQPAPRGRASATGGHRAGRR